MVKFESRFDEIISDFEQKTVDLSKKCADVGQAAIDSEKKLDILSKEHDVSFLLNVYNMNDKLFV